MTDDEHLTALSSTELEQATDQDLIVHVRAGSTAAYEQLFLRHRTIAVRYARRIAGPERAEDLVAEAFTKILDLLQRGKGPEVSFRAYLLTTVRTSHLNAIRLRNREDLVPDHEPIGRMMPVIEDPDARFEQDAICRAYYQLPERWQAALWLTAVEGYSNGEVGERLGIRPNAVASLAFRARGGLRQAYLSEHLRETDDPACRRIVEQLPNHLRGTLSPRRQSLVDEHLAGCRSCTTAALEIAHVDNELGALLAPLLVIGLALASTTVVVPAKTTGLALVGTLATKAGAGALAKTKAATAAAPGVAGSKIAVAVSVTAVGLAVGSQVIHPHPVVPDAPDVTITAPRRLEIVAEPVPTATAFSAPRAPAKTLAAIPWPRLAASGPATPAPAPRTTPYAAPPAAPPAARPDPTTAAPSPSPPAEPTTPTSPTPSPSVPVATRTMAIGTVTNQSYTRHGVRRQQVTVPVDNPVEGATMVVSTDRSIETPTASTDGTGWICGTPQMNWADGLLFATSQIRCQYFANGDGGPLVFDHTVSQGSWLTLNLLPPAGPVSPPGGGLVELLLRP